VWSTTSDTSVTIFCGGCRSPGSPSCQRNWEGIDRGIPGATFLWKKKLIWEGSGEPGLPPAPFFEENVARNVWKLCTWHFLTLDLPPPPTHSIFPSGLHPTQRSASVTYLSRVVLRFACDWALFSLRFVSILQRIYRWVLPRLEKGNVHVIEFPSGVARDFPHFLEFYPSMRKGNASFQGLISHLGAPK